MSDGQEAQPGAVDLAPSTALVRVGDIGLATALGFPLAGGALLAINCCRLARATPSHQWEHHITHGSARVGVTMSLLATAVVLGVTLYIGPQWHQLALLYSLTGFSAVAIAQRATGAAVARHYAAGGQMLPRSVALGVGLAGFATVMTVAKLVRSLWM